MLYLLKYKSREELCEFDTNKIVWKEVRKHIQVEAGEMDIFKAIGAYNPFGPKEEEYKEYEKLEFIQNNIEGINPDMVDNFSVALGKLLRWLKFAIEVRIDDVVKRRKKKEFERAQREEAIAQEEERQAIREERLKEAMAEWEEEQEKIRLEKEEREEGVEKDEDE